MEQILKYSKDKPLMVYLTVNENGETQNCFSTIGTAIDAIAYDAGRIMPNNIIEQTLTSYKWKGNNGENHSLEIKECPICKDVTLDYMNKPRSITIEKK